MRNPFALRERFWRDELLSTITAEIRAWMWRPGHRILHKTWRAVSATLGGSDTKSEATSFASTLFGSSFVSDSMILGTRSAIKSKRMFLHWPELVRLLSEEGEGSLSSLLRGEEPAADSALWGRLADALGIPNTSVEKSKPTGERLGGLLVESGLADHVRGVIESQVDSCIDLDSLAELICANAGNPRLTVGKVLSLLALASHNREPVLALRTHLLSTKQRPRSFASIQSVKPCPEGRTLGGVAFTLPTTRHATYVILACIQCSYVADAASCI